MYSKRGVCIIPIGVKPQGASVKTRVSLKSAKNLFTNFCSKTLELQDNSLPFMSEIIKYLLAYVFYSVEEFLLKTMI
jgi:hypothetical protein